MRRVRILSVLTSTALILACALGKKDEGDKDGILGGGDDGVEQDPTCADYLSCLAAVDPGTLASVQSTYGTDGTCWTDDTSAAQCAEACQTGLEQMHDSYPGEAACDDGSAVTAGDLEGTWRFETEEDASCEGYTVGVEDMQLAISADGDDAFLGNGSAVQTFDGNEFDIDLSFECSFDGRNFTCDEYYADYDTYWEFFGGYGDGIMIAHLTEDIGDGEGGVICTVEYDLNGTRD